MSTATITSTLRTSNATSAQPGLFAALLKALGVTAQPKTEQSDAWTYGARGL